MSSPTRAALVMCAWIAGYAAGGARLAAEPCSPACVEPAICNEDSGECFNLDLNCPAGGPIAQFNPAAIGIATNELLDGIYDAPVHAGLLAEIGVRRAQTAISWQTVQPTASSTYNWIQADKQINDLANAGLAPVAILGDPAPWAGRGDRILDVPAWRAFVNAAVLRYGSAGTNRVRDWQLENEPNLPASPYAGDADGYGALLSATLEEIHSAQATARVWGPSVVWHMGNDGYGSGWPGIVGSSTMDYLLTVLDVAVPDVVSIHIYEPDPERMLDIYLAVVDQLAKRQSPLLSIPIVVNEGHFGNGPGRSNNGCPYDTGQGLIAQDISNFYSCLLSTNASEVLWFNSSDRFTPGASCNPAAGDIRQTGVLGFEDNPPIPRAFPRIKDAYFALRAVRDAQAARSAATARLAALPSTCRIASEGGTCSTTLVWTGRTASSGALQVWRAGTPNPVFIGCTANWTGLGQAVVQLSSSPARFELRSAINCVPSSNGTLLDRVTTRGDASLASRPRGAVFALDSPCSTGPGDTACSMALAWWSSGSDTLTYPKVKILANGTVFRCENAGTAGIADTGVWENGGGILFRLYEATACGPSGTLGRLLAVTRGGGLPQP